MDLQRNAQEYLNVQALAVDTNGASLPVLHCTYLQKIAKVLLVLDHNRNLLNKNLSNQIEDLQRRAKNSNTDQLSKLFGRPYSQK